MFSCDIQHLHQLQELKTIDFVISREQYLKLSLIADDIFFLEDIAVLCSLYNLA